MGAGRAGWYSGMRSTTAARQVRPHQAGVQTVVPGDIMPAIPGAWMRSLSPPSSRPGISCSLFATAVAERGRVGTPSSPDGRRKNAAHRARTRVIPLARPRSREAAYRSSPLFIERAYAGLARLPRPLLIGLAALGHRIMEARHLRGIQRRCAARQAKRGTEPFGVRPCSSAASPPRCCTPDDLGHSIRGLQPHFSGSERTDGDWGPDATVVGAAGANLHPAGRRLWVGHVGIRRTKSCPANRRRPDSGLRISWASCGLLPRCTNVRCWRPAEGR